MTGSRSLARITAGIILAAVLPPLIASAQLTKQDSLWLPLAFLEGSWKGAGTSGSGAGAYERTYAFIFNKKFLEVHNTSSYAPSATHPTGEVHKDVGYISYDKRRRCFVLRQFHIEGFVNQYRLESISPDGKRIVFISEAIENIAPGWRAKESYEKHDDGSFTETFELAAPEKDFEMYSRVTLKRSE